MLHMKLNEFMENSVIIMKVKYEGYVYSNRTFIFVYAIKIENIFLLFRIFFFNTTPHISKMHSKISSLKSINTFSTLSLFYRLPQKKKRFPEMSILNTLLTLMLIQSIFFLIICTPVYLQNIKRKKTFCLYNSDHCKLQKH